MNAQLKKGLLDVCVLAVLNRGESYGYKILKDLSAYIELSESTLYPILRRLETGKYVTVRSLEHEGRLRKMYTITKAGKAQLVDFLSDWKEVETIYQYIKEGIDRDERNVSGGAES